MSRAMPLAGAQALERWQRVGLAVRLAYDSRRPCVMACYVGMGRQLAERGLLSAVESEERMYRLLLQTATDLALPAGWRQYALRHALNPLSQLTALLAHQPFNVTALQARWDLARRQLAVNDA